MLHLLANELWFCIAAFMRPDDRFLFAATCKRARAIVAASWTMWKLANDWNGICEWLEFATDDPDVFAAYLRAWCWSRRAMYDVVIIKELTRFFHANPSVVFKKKHFAVFTTHPVEKALFGDIWTSGNVTFIERARAVIAHRFTVASHDLPVLRSDVRMRVSEVVARSVRKHNGKRILVRLDNFLVRLFDLYTNDSVGFLRFCSKARRLLFERVRSVAEVRAWLDDLQRCYDERESAEPMSADELRRLAGPWRSIQLGELAQRGSEVDGENVPS